MFCPFSCGEFAVQSGVRVQACQGLLLCLPSYAYLVGPAVSGAPVWEADSVLASRMQFLMSMLGPCIPRLSQVPPSFCGVHSQLSHRVVQRHVPLGICTHDISFRILHSARCGILCAPSPCCTCCIRTRPWPPLPTSYSVQCYATWTWCDAPSDHIHLYSSVRIAYPCLPGHPHDLPRLRFLSSSCHGFHRCAVPTRAQSPVTGDTRIQAKLTHPRVLPRKISLKHCRVVGCWGHGLGFTIRLNGPLLQ